MALLKRKAREKKYGRHSPAGYRYLQQEKRKIAYYGTARESADSILRRIKRGK